MAPSDPNVPDSGTAIALLTEDRSKTLALGRSDENGEFHGRISRRFIGQTLFFPVRHAGFEYDHELAIVVQPWGLFHAVRMRPDPNYNGNSSASDVAFIPKATQKYIRAEVDTQFAARNAIRRTVWFWMAVGLCFVTTLLTVGLPKWIGFIAAVVALAIRAYFKKRSLGLSARPIHLPPQT